MDTDSEIADDIPRRVLQKFGDESARPKLVRSYDSQSGWSADSGSPVLTWQMVDELIKIGKTSVELKWHRKRHQISLLDLRVSHKPKVRKARTGSRLSPGRL